MPLDHSEPDVDRLSADQLDTLSRFTLLCFDMQKHTAEKLHIDEETLGDILSGKRIVERIIFDKGDREGF